MGNNLQFEHDMNFNFDLVFSNFFFVTAENKSVLYKISKKVGPFPF